MPYVVRPPTPKKTSNQVDQSSTQRSASSYRGNVPETNSSPLKMDSWETAFLLEKPMFRGENVSFRERNLLDYVSNIPGEDWLPYGILKTLGILVATTYNKGMSPWLLTLLKS